MWGEDPVLTMASLGLFAYGLYSVGWAIADLIRGARLELWAELGVMAFVHCPPTEPDNLVARLWDKHMRPDWREDAETPEQILTRRRATGQDAGGSAAEFRARIENAAPLAPGQAARYDGEPAYVVIARQVPIYKGKWRLVPEEAEN